ncbi:MAG: hypothetical protein ABR572_03785 [Cryomorphaceae bacterium]|nr:hypothetical protein [Flavobacteriales bacterium]
MSECNSAVSTCPYQNADAEEPPYTITVQCEHRASVPYVSDIGLVPSVGLTVPYRDTLQLFYEGPDPPDQLEASGLEIEGGGGRFQANFEIDPGEWFYQQAGKADGPGELASLALMDAFRRMWTYGSKKSYVLRGMPVNIPVTIYNPEQWKLKLSIPPARQTKVGAKYGTHRDSGKTQLAHEESNHNFRTGEGSTTKTTLTDDQSMNSIAEGSESTTLESDSSDSTSNFGGLTITRDGAAMQFDGVNAILALVSVIRMGTELMKEIQDNVPKVGWYIESDVTVLDADLELQWGWKEFTDEKAFYAVSAKCTVNLIKVKIEFGFGVSGVIFKAQLFASGEGAIPLNLDIVRDNPEMALEFSVGIHGVITFMVGARAEVAYIIRCQIDVSSGIEVGGDFKVRLGAEKGFGIEADINFTGVIGTVTWSVGPGGGGGGTRSGGASGSQNSREFVAPEKLWEWKWPDDPPSPSSDLLDANGFRDQLRFDALRQISYTTEVKRQYGCNRDDSRDWVAAHIAEDFKSKFYSDDILRERKAIQGLCTLVRIRLEELIELQGRGHNAITLANWRYFVSEEMPQIMADMVDPMSEYSSSPGWNGPEFELA